MAATYRRIAFSQDIVIAGPRPIVAALLLASLLVEARSASGAEKGAPEPTTTTSTPPPAAASAAVKPRPAAKPSCRPHRLFPEVGPWAAGVATGVAFGFGPGLQGTVELFAGRRFWNRLELEARFQVGAGKGVESLTATARVGVLLQFGRRWELALAWKLGYVHFFIDMPEKPLRAGAFSTTALAELRVLLTPVVELRLTPLAATGFFNEIWGFTVDPSVSLAFRF